MSDTATSDRQSPLRPLLYVAAAAAAALVVAGLVGGLAVAEKGAATLVMPVGLLWLGLAVLCLALRRGEGRLPLAIAVCLWLALSLAGNRHVSELLFRGLERDVWATLPLQEKPFDYVVLLGGGCSVAPNGEVQAGEAGDRVVLAARLYLAGVAHKIVCSGERIRGLNPHVIDPARRAETILRSLGVPAAAIEIVGGIDTADEMRNLSGRFGPHDRVGLITSAWHLPRAQRHATSAGLRFEPLPADFRTPLDDDRWPPPGALILGLFPTSVALHQSTRAIKEYIAMATGY